MKNKNYLKVTVMLFAIALFFAGCSGETKKDDETSKVKDNEKVEKSSTINVTKGKMNDAMLVEILAQMTYITAKYSEDLENKTPEEAVKISEKMSKDLEDIFENLGVTEDEYEAYSEKLEKNPTLYLKITTQMGERVEELQKEGK
ncbi:MAG: hypothetical protein U9P82_08165 [Bacteroidota bacterium]|nr:hypothetical protein [Bacteroidota bacterium]